MIGGSRPRGIGSTSLPTPAKRAARHWWGGRRHEHLHFETKQHSRRRSRIKHVLIPVVIVLLILAALSIRAVTASDPRLSTARSVPPSVVLTGQAPAPAWPAQGQAAVEVEGLLPLGSSGGDSPVPIASLAKVMTAFVVLQAHPLVPGQSGFTVTVSPADVADYDRRSAAAQSVVRVGAGETLSELQLLQGLLVPSANNYAAMLASYISGSTAAFVARMNSAASELGMAHTTYTDPAGLAATTVSTAGDQLVLATRVTADPVFAQIVALPSVDLPIAGPVSNFNSAVGHNGYVGIKTGSDSTSGGCLMFANTQPVDGHRATVVGVVLGQDVGSQSTSRLIGAAVYASTKLVDSVHAAIGLRTVLAKGSVVGVVASPQGATVGLRTTDALEVIGYGGEKVPLTVTVRPAGTTLTAGQSLGRVSVGAESTPVVAERTMPTVTFFWKLLHDF